MKPTKEQSDVIDFLRAGKGNVLVNAVAGSGKTTLLTMIAEFLKAEKPSDAAIFTAFSKAIQEEISRKFKKKGLLSPMMEVKTVHSVGLRMLREYLGSQPSVDGSKYYKLMKPAVVKLQKAFKKDTDIEKKMQPKYNTIRGWLKQIIDKGRLYLLSFENEGEVLKLLHHYGVHIDQIMFSRVFNEACEIVKQGNSLALVNGNIDFNDMIYLPYKWDLEPNREDQKEWVLVDECQDLSDARRKILEKLVVEGGRMIYVGDPHQSIFGFAGADTQSVQNILEASKAKEFPLSVCFRCDQHIIQLAQSLVSHIQPREGAEDGEIINVEAKNVFSHIEEGDLVICRRTAPLISLCIQLIGRKMKAFVMGRDIGKQIIALVDEVEEYAGGYFDYENFLELLDQYVLFKITRLSGGDEENGAAIDALTDKVRGIATCYESFDNAESLEGLKKEIENLFADEAEGVTLCTVHRAKGLENEKVIIYQYDTMPLVWKKQQDWEFHQELCLLYVAITRAKHMLVRVYEERDNYLEAEEEMLLQEEGG